MEFLTTNNHMLSLFKKQSKSDQLYKKYNKLQEEAFRLSKIDRTASDLKYAEADELMNQIKGLEEN